MQSSTQQKQRFLREQIIESNYDPEQFINFLNSDLKIQQLDVEHMDMQTLQSVVLKFKQYKYYHPENKTTEKSIKNKQKKQKIEYEKYGGMATFDYEFQEQIKCIQNQPFTQTLEIFVPNIEVVEKNGIFFSKTEVWYIVKSNAHKVPVKRLEEDFSWLSNTIAKLHPLTAIPELVGVLRQHQGNHERRRKELQEYLRILAQNNEMRRSSILQDFLTLPLEKIEKMKKNYDSMSFVKSIHSVKSQSGNLTISLTNKIRNYVLSTQDYLRKIPRIHENIEQCLHKVSQYLENTSKQIYKVVDYFAEAHQLYISIANKSPEYKVAPYSEILIDINNFYNGIANDLIQKSHSIHHHLKDYSKVALNHDKSMYKVFRDISIAEKEYLVFKNNLNRKKERVYPEVTKWEVDEKTLQNRRLTQEEAFELMLPRQTAQLNEQKKWLAYIYCNFRDQFNSYLNFEVKRYSSVYSSFCSQLLLNNKAYVQQLTKFIDESKRLNPNRPAQQ